MMDDSLNNASVNDLLLNYVQAYTRWLERADTPQAFEDNEIMVAIGAEFRRRDAERIALAQEIERLKTVMVMPSQIMALTMHLGSVTYKGVATLETPDEHAADA